MYQLKKGHQLEVEKLTTAIAAADRTIELYAPEHARLTANFERMDKAKDHKHIKIREMHKSKSRLEGRKQAVESRMEPPPVPVANDWQHDLLPECQAAVLNALQASCREKIQREGRSSHVKSVITMLSKVELEKLTRAMLIDMWGIMSRGGFARNGSCPINFKSRRNTSLLRSVYDHSREELVNYFLDALYLDVSGNPIIDEE
jgi:hypothetical protein